MNRTGDVGRDGRNSSHVSIVIAAHRVTDVSVHAASRGMDATPPYTAHTHTAPRFTHTHTTTTALAADVMLCYGWTTSAIVDKRGWWFGSQTRLCRISIPTHLFTTCPHHHTHNPLLPYLCAYAGWRMRLHHLLHCACCTYWPCLA